MIRRELTTDEAEELFESTREHHAAMMRLEVKRGKMGTLRRILEAEIFERHETEKLIAAILVDAQKLVPLQPSSLVGGQALAAYLSGLIYDEAERMIEQEGGAA